MILKPCPSNQSKSKKTSLRDVSKNNPEGLFRGVRIISSPPHLVTKCMTLSRVHAYRELRWFWARIHQSDQRPDNRMSVRKILSDYRVVFNVPELICTHWSAIQSQALNMFNIFNVHNCSKSCRSLNLLIPIKVRKNPIDYRMSLKTIDCNYPAVCDVFSAIFFPFGNRSWWHL